MEDVSYTAQWTAAARAVPGVKRQRCGGNRFLARKIRFGHVSLPRLTWQGAARCRPVAMPPLSREPESFRPCAHNDGPAWSYPFGGPGVPERFPECPFQPRGPLT